MRVGMKQFSSLKVWVIKSVFVALLVCGFLLLLLCWSNYIVVRKSNPYIYSSLEKLPALSVAVVLGTSSYTSEGNKKRALLRTAYRSSKALSE